MDMKKQAWRYFQICFFFFIFGKTALAVEPGTETNLEASTSMESPSGEHYPEAIHRSVNTGVESAKTSVPADESKQDLGSHSSSSFTQTTFVITAQHWAMPRQADTLIALPPLAKAVSLFRTMPGARLVIRYPGGDEGSLWLNELQSWLVALGIASKDMELVPGSSQQTVIELEVIENGNRMQSNHYNSNNRYSLITGVKP